MPGLWARVFSDASWDLVVGLEGPVRLKWPQAGTTGVLLLGVCLEAFEGVVWVFAGPQAVPILLGQYRLRASTT